MGSLSIIFWPLISTFVGILRWTHYSFRSCVKAVQEWMSNLVLMVLYFLIHLFFKHLQPARILFNALKIILALAKLYFFQDCNSNIFCFKYLLKKRHRMPFLKLFLYVDLYRLKSRIKIHWMNVDIKTISEFVVADHFKLIGIILIGILNHVENRLILCLNVYLKTHTQLT